MNNIGYIFIEPSNGLPPIWKTSHLEPYHIRHYDPSVLRDIETLNTMDLQSNLGGLTSSSTDLEDHNADHFFAITNEHSHTVGWVWYYLDPAHTFPRELSDSLKLDKNETKFFEVSYQKLDHQSLSPEALASSNLEPHFICQERRGVAVSGVRQTLPYLRAITSQSKLVVYAFTDLDNIASSKVLEKNNFLCAKVHVDYDGKPNYFWYKII